MPGTFRTTVAVAGSGRAGAGVGGGACARMDGARIRQSRKRRAILAKAFGMAEPPSGQYDDVL
jgi:hypothetical protein